ncbi:MAG TPA: amino acid adenylation domain-containing protein [Actinospica sp.]|jgi:amino acid adenylation domain-containing protein|nr:amino acid adenylation domain-containing protein [Actinospica sp.]
MAETTTVAPIGLPTRLSAEQAARPVFVGAEPMTYGELEVRVEAAARRLRELGAAPGDRIAIWTGKSPRYAEAILAALRTGCAYVPLDGGQPPDRAHTILADAEPVVLITDRARLDALADRPLPTSLTVIALVDDEPATTHQGIAVRPWASMTAPGPAAPQPARVPTPDDLAAILYTSGSTGTPKGVMISHRNLANFIGWARTELDLSPRDVFANHASFNFDLSTFDLFTALAVGASLWIVEDRQARDVSVLARGIREFGVTVWYSVPSILHLLTTSGALTPDATASLRYVLFAGEVFPIPHLRALAERLPEATGLYNLYGPTETNVCTYYRLAPEDLTRTEPVPIGAPISATTITVIDEHGAACTGPDAFGELVVEGDCVTPGYWRRPDEPATAHHRLGRHPTGDLVSYEHGLLVYRGRTDRLVKLSGYRIELGEIEAAVTRHPDIDSAAVVLAGAAGAARLRLFYTLRPGADRLTIVQIKKHCARYLPTYMLPHLATQLTAMPRNPNGKTDYRRLSG